MWFFVYLIGYIIIILIGVIWIISTIIGKIREASEKEKKRINEIERLRNLKCHYSGCEKNALSNNEFFKTCEYCNLKFCKEHSIEREFEYLGYREYCITHQGEFSKDEKKEKLIAKREINEELKRKREEEEKIRLLDKLKSEYLLKKKLDSDIDECYVNDCYELNNLTPCSNCYPTRGRMMCKRHTKCGTRCEECDYDLDVMLDD